MSEVKKNNDKELAVTSGFAALANAGAQYAATEDLAGFALTFDRKKISAGG